MMFIRMNIFQIQQNLIPYQYISYLKFRYMLEQVNQKKDNHRYQIRKKQIQQLFSQYRQQRSPSSPTKYLQTQLTAPAIKQLFMEFVDNEHQLLPQQLILQLINYVNCQQLSSSQTDINLILWLFVNECYKNHHLPQRIIISLFQMAQLLLPLNDKTYNQYLTLMFGNMCDWQDNSLVFIEVVRVKVIQQLSQTIYPQNEQDFSFLVLNLLKHFPVNGVNNHLQLLAFLYQYVNKKLADILLTYANELNSSKHQHQDYFFLTDLTRSINKLLYLFEGMENIQLQHPENSQCIGELSINILTQSPKNPQYESLYNQIWNFISQLLSICPSQVKSLNILRETIMKNMEKLMQVFRYWILAHKQETHDNIWTIIYFCSNTTYQHSMKKSLISVLPFANELQQRKIINYLMRYKYEQQSFIENKVERHLLDKSTCKRYLDYSNTQSHRQLILQIYKNDQEIQDMLDQ